MEMLRFLGNIILMPETADELQGMLIDLPGDSFPSLNKNMNKTKVMFNATA